MALKFLPLGDRLLIKRIKEKEKTEGGLYLPDVAREKQQEAHVLAVGPGRYDDGKVIPLDLKIGDRILVGKYSGVEIVLDGEDCVIVHEEDILGVLK